MPSLEELAIRTLAPFMQVLPDADLKNSAGLNAFRVSRYVWRQGFIALTLAEANNTYSLRKTTAAASLHDGRLVPAEVRTSVLAISQDDYLMARYLTFAVLAASSEVK